MSLGYCTTYLFLSVPIDHPDSLLSSQISEAHLGRVDNHDILTKIKQKKNHYEKIKLKSWKWKRDIFPTLLLAGVLKVEDDVLARLASGEESCLSAGLFLGILFIPAELGNERWIRGILTSSCEPTDRHTHTHARNGGRSTFGKHRWSIDIFLTFKFSFVSVGRGGGSFLGLNAFLSVSFNPWL